MGINNETGILSNSKKFTLLPPLMKYFSVTILMVDISDRVVDVMYLIVSLLYILQLYLRFNHSYNFSKSLSEIEVTGIALCAYNYGVCVFINIFNLTISNGDLFLAIALNFVIAYLVYLLKKNSWNNKLN